MQESTEMGTRLSSELRKKIVIAEDHAIVRDGLKALLSAEDDFIVVGEACNGFEAAKVAKEVRPDIILMDLLMPRKNGLDAIKEIKKSCPEIKILVLTVHKAETYVLESLKAGANGYVLKDSGRDELLLAIHHVLDGESYLSPGIMDNVIQTYLKEKTVLSTKDPVWESMTNREKEILKLVAEGYMSREIAGLLFISVATVKKHRDNLMKKLDIHSVSEVTRYALLKGLIEN